MALLADLRFGWRTLAASPGSTLAAAASLGLGIAVATCAYSEVNGLILRDLPAVRQPSDLEAFETPIAYPAYERYRELSGVFVSMSAYVAPVPFNVATTGGAERVWGQLITRSYFATLGLRPWLGRFFDPGERERGAVISYRFWERRLGGDRNIVGRLLRVNGRALTAIGVAPKDFLGASGYFPADLWVPVDAGAEIAPELANDALHRRDAEMFQVTGRVQPGVSEARAQAALDAAARQLERDYGDAERDRGGPRVRLVPGGKLLPIRRRDRPFFTEVLMLMGGLMLLIACSNVANLSLARARRRRREIAVRLSLGASRSRLVRQLLTENMMLAAGAGALAFAASVWIMRLASQIRLPFPIPLTFDLSPDWRVFGFAAAVTAGTGLAFGFIPAFESTRADLVESLKAEAGARFVRRRAMSVRNILMVCQMAGSVTLLLLTGFLGIGIQTTMGVAEKFDARDLYLASLDPARDGYAGPQAAAFFDKLITRVRSLPAIAAAAITESFPVGIEGNTGARFEDAGAKAMRAARRHVVGEGYFETAGIPILQGRSFRKEDGANGSAVVIVSQELARESWPAGDALGRRLEIAAGEPSGGLGVMPGSFDFREGQAGRAPREFEVEGVAADVSEDLIASKKHPAIYFPLRAADYARPSPRGVTLLFRGRPGVDAVAAVEREIAATDAAVTVFHARSMTEEIAQFMSSLRSAAWTWSALGLFGLVLAAAGLAGVTAYGVAQRGREIGIRVALGAQKGDVLALVMKEGFVMIALGTAAGAGFTWAGVRAMSAFFFTVASVKSFEPAVLFGAPALLASLALAACYAAARRALAVDPASALRCE